ncbi:MULTISPECIES: PAS domain S-box protein [unclassified Methanoregula]|uniref:PAS domain S-box protein n=1 Tax=unclassified Methanoregula TaxID=2649730 RepID=UPI0009C9E619|nr:MULTISPECIES: PAS domain S-box protein [unclassified Methanoregula]OPX62863.1 MAG: putative diguanylate cyclase [Methanoregula sp. PtaB.Bin085]OPY35300.1 MAG: putative diguanylate cyclase [Methanoregula sp. PtaU1.Bin006]
MVESEHFGEREESLNNLWLFIIINTTVLALLINILSLHYGNNDVAPNLFYIPVVIAAYWYPHRGPLFAGVISVAYMSLVWYFLGSDAWTLISSSVICYVMIGVSVVVSSLATHMRRNEVKYRGIFNHSEAGVGLVNLSSLSIKEVNERFVARLGYTREEVMAVPFGELWADADHKDTFFRNLKTQGSIENMETRFRSRDKGDRWVLVSAGMLPDNQFVVTLVDITDRKQAEELLLIKDHAIRSSINAIAILDLDFTITYVNQSLTKMLDYYHDNEIIGKNLGTFMTAPRTFGEIRDTLQKAGSWFGEVILLKYNRNPFYVLLWANLVRDETGTPVCVMISFIDITDRKQMEIAKRKALEQIEHNIEQFAILGDHIRNPLAVIVGLSSLAPGDITDKIILQAKEIDRIITQLDMGWIESEKVRDFIKRYYMVGAGELADGDKGMAAAPGDAGK